MQTRWEMRKINREYALRLQQTHQIPFPIARALAARSLTEEEVPDFLDPRLSNLSDPFLLPAMKEAVARILLAIDREEPMVVFGDYDVDGITATALLVQMLKALGGKVEPFIPQRLEEGYGLSKPALKRCLQEHAPTLLISVDCGTNAKESVDWVIAQKVDVIITDHHEPVGDLATPLALVNPKLDTNSKTKFLAGVGVAFKVAHAILKQAKQMRAKHADAIDLRNFLDLVALGTVADIVPLYGENRILVRHGLFRMARTQTPGLQALKSVSGMRNDPPNTYHLGFQMAPRINAAGRIAQPLKALHLLLTKDRSEARHLAEFLDQTNRSRQKMEQQMFLEAFEEIDTYFDPQTSFGLVVAREGWHPGVIGIVASRIARRYHRPTVVLGIENEKVHGSCRSIEGYEILEGLKACSAHLQEYGGHKMAAGLRMAASEVDAFRTCFNQSVKSTIPSEALLPRILLDAEVLPMELNLEFFKAQEKLAPFGEGNREPLWIMRAMRCVGSPRVVGQKHLKFFCQSEKGGQRFEAIAFNFPEEDLPKNGSMDLAFHLKVWGKELQLQIQQIRPTRTE
jgi:single-stranded-DNA-specific exonuclease